MMRMWRFLILWLGESKTQKDETGEFRRTIHTHWLGEGASVVKGSIVLRQAVTSVEQKRLSLQKVWVDSCLPNDMLDTACNGLQVVELLMPCPRSN